MSGMEPPDMGHPVVVVGGESIPMSGMKLPDMGHPGLWFAGQIG